MTEQVNTLDLSDSELKHLYEILLSTKINATAHELLLIKMGRSQSAVLDLTLKIAQVWESRAAQIQQQEAAKSVPVAIPDPE